MEFVTFIVLLARYTELGSPNKLISESFHCPLLMQLVTCIGVKKKFEKYSQVSITMQRNIFTTSWNEIEFFQIDSTLLV